MARNCSLWSQNRGYVRMDGKGKIKNIYVIGAGGIASALIRPLKRYLGQVPITVIDGDITEDKNADRQEGITGVSKATYWAQAIEGLQAVTEYVTPSNIDKLIPKKEDSIIFACVDNHATRKLLQDHCKKMQSVILISGGNELFTGDVRIFIRQGRRDKTPRIDHLQPEIQNPTDKRPDEVSCSELVESEPQILFMNNAVAAAMLNTLHFIDDIDYNVVYIDIKQNKQATLNTGDLK